jgi:hypothetical protein
MLYFVYIKNGGVFMEIDFFSKCEIEEDIGRIQNILRTEIFLPPNINHPLCKSAFIEILICLRDLMYKCEKYSSRINFTDDVIQTSKVSDVTDLIKYVRDALCHPDIPNHYIEKNNIKASYNVAYGKCNLMKIGDTEICSDYNDDICFFFGSQKIYFKRHILRAFEEAKDNLSKLL